jgi:catechol 2,3-dioxygenase-like lactoylglutathione lyase family enzyme
MHRRRRPVRGSRDCHGAPDGNAGTDHAHGTGIAIKLVDLTLDDAKTAARALRRTLAAADVTISHSRALEIVATQLGFTDWNTASAQLSARPASFGPAVPVLRIHDEAPAREFYVDYLGFSVEWEHRFEPGMPLYLRVRRGQAVLDLSEHHGDGTPGTVVWLPIPSAAALHAELSRRPHPRLRPGIDRDAPGGPTIEVTDPFGNVLRLCEPVG